ncbi:unnamed protein product [Microthlaspi erraticum]|uniref:Rho termination factor-like N-terminal domain-containing protein n=1 Tax=Microthlaspi erraticum TaxID=1685480 RepID=A0A6D2KYD4_9BRAS|nr:unnamed protein product [Microthlaspi erraticum]
MDDDDLWGPPFVVQDDTFRKQILRGCEFWFDFRTDVLEVNFQNERYCELVWRILTEKKQDAEMIELDKDSASLQIEMASSGTATGDSHDVITSSDSDKTVSAILPDAETSSSNSALDEDENSSSISDAQTIETRDSSNEKEGVDPETRLKPQEAPANDPVAVEVAEDADKISLSPVLAGKIEEAEEHSCSSLVTDQVSDPIKPAPEDKSSSDISQENTEGSTLKPLVLETGEKVVEIANAATNEDGEISKDPQEGCDSVQEIVAVSEPFTTESLLEMCDGPEKCRETSCDDEKGKISHPEAVKTAVKDVVKTAVKDAVKKTVVKDAVKTVGVQDAVKKTAVKDAAKKTVVEDAVKTVVVQDAVKTVVVKDELIINMLTEARQKAESNALLKAGSVLLKKRKSMSNSSMKTSFIRNTKQKVGGGGEAGGEVKTDTVKKSKPEIIRAPTLELIARIRQTGVISVSDLKDKTGKELRSIAKEMKITHYYKLNKGQLLQRLTMQIESQLTDCTKQRENGDITVLSPVV